MEILNQGTITYNYNSSRATMQTISNVNTVTLVLDNDITIDKRALSSTYIPQGSAGYQITIKNTGENTLYNVTVTDNLGTNNELEYVSGSATLISGDTLKSITPSSLSPLTFNLPNMLSGESMFITYLTKVTTSMETTSITNTANVSANGGSTTGEQVTASSEETITLEEFAKLTVTKTSSTDTVSEGEPFDYIFTVTNSGNQTATGVVLTDELSTNFTINSISVNNGSITEYTPADYDYSGGVLALPNSTGTPINVGVGESVQIVINGTINNA